MRTVFAALAVVALSSAPACAPGDVADDQVEELDEVEEAADGSTYTYYLARPDYRKCAYPMCGGYWVHRVNRAKTKCADGSWQSECYVAEVDYEAVGLSETQRSEVNYLFREGLALVRGSIGTMKSDFGDIGVMLATEAWQAEAWYEPTGTFYRVESSGIVCITYPCPSLTELKLNSAVNKLIHGLDLESSGAPWDRVEAGYASLATDAVLVAGTHESFTGPAGKGKALIASEFYTRVVAEPEVVECGPNTCAEGEYCCNESCGICAPEGGFCTYQLCEEPPTPQCTTNDDCRTFSSYCGECACFALSSLDTDPVCSDPPVTCFVDPCMDQQAVCANGGCVLIIP